MKNNNSKPAIKGLLHPRQWPVWLAVGLLWLLAQLPYRWLLKLGEGIVGKLLYHFSSKARRTAETNLALCFPELTAVQRKNLLKQNFAATGISLLETALAWWGKEQRLCHLLKVHGMEHLEQALAKGNGVILCSAHFMSLELAGRLLAMQQPFAVIYRPQKNILLDKLAKRYRQKIYQRIIARGDLRSMLKYLKHKGVVWYTPDIDAGLNNSVFVPFFNIPAATITATSRLAQLSQAQVIPTFPFRRQDGTGYDIYMHAPLTHYPSGDSEQDARRLNQIIETAIEQAPEQYLWQYKRFKTRPLGEKRFYD